MDVVGVGNASESNSWGSVLYDGFSWGVFNVPDLNINLRRANKDGGHVGSPHDVKDGSLCVRI
jgi:hypothetical protein